MDKLSPLNINLLEGKTKLGMWDTSELRNHRLIILKCGVALFLHTSRKTDSSCRIFPCYLVSRISRLNVLYFKRLVI